MFSQQKKKNLRSVYCGILQHFWNLHLQQIKDLILQFKKKKIGLILLWFYDVPAAWPVSSGGGV